MQSSPRVLGRARAFTMVELLAVVLIISILAALMIPGIQKVRAGAMAAACNGRLKQIGAAFRVYAAENEGLFPAPRYREPEEPGKNPSHGGWTTELLPYMSGYRRAKYDESFVCPQFFTTYGKDPRYATGGTGGYGMNPRVGNSAGSVYDYRFNHVLITASSSRILAGDSVEYHLDINASGGTWKKAPEHLGGYASGQPDRHMGRANYLFADGHIETLNPSDAEAALNGNITR